MPQKLLKYGIGIFMPEYPDGFDPAALASHGEKLIEIPAGQDAGTVSIEIPAGASFLKISVGANARVRFVESIASASDASVRLELGEGARAEYLSGAKAGIAFVRREARLAGKAKLEWIDECSAPEFARSSFKTRLEGEGAEVEASSLLRGAGRQRFDMLHEIVHAAPRTVSGLRVGSVLSGDAKAIVRGLVRVEKNAPGCVSRQKAETLLLSGTAEIDAVPMLEIENQDVRCSHAATVGRLDAEKLFYLMSRGLDRAAADQLLIEAFVEPYLSRFSACAGGAQTFVIPSETQ